MPKGAAFETAFRFGYASIHPHVTASTTTVSPKKQAPSSPQAASYPAARPAPMTLRLSAAARQALITSAAANGLTARAWIERCLLQQLPPVGSAAATGAIDADAQVATSSAPSDGATRTAAFRLGASAHALLYARAAEAGLSTRAWLEQAILANRTEVVAKSRPGPDLKALIFQVNKTGNNLNQLAHHFNSLHKGNQLTGAQFIEGLAVLSQIEQGLAEALVHARQG